MDTEKLEPMDIATNAAMQSLGHDIPTDVMALARNNATEILRNSTSDDEKGLKDLQNLTLSMGLPITRIMFQYMLDDANIKGSTKKIILQDIDAISPITEIGCMKVDFFNKKTNQADVAYLVLDRCSNNHCLSTQLDKLKNVVADVKWPDVIRSISMLIHIGRSVYSQVSRKNINIIRQIYNKSINDCAKYLDLQVDLDNTTLYLDESWLGRVGIYIKLNDEI